MAVSKLALLALFPSLASSLTLAAGGFHLERRMEYKKKKEEEEYSWCQPTRRRRGRPLSRNHFFPF